MKVNPINSKIAITRIANELHGHMLNYALNSTDLLKAVTFTLKYSLSIL